MGERFTGKVVLVTGAARGQGRNHAIRFAEAGADVIAFDICEDIPGVPYPGPTQADLEQTVKEVESHGRRIVAARVDIRDLDALQSATDDAVAQLGRLDIVLCNAAIAAYEPEAATMPYENWRTMIDIDLNGTYHTCRVAIAHLKAGGRGGSIIITNSVAGLAPFMNVAHYNTAKHGLVGLAKSLALELGADSIRVNSIHPTQVNTPMADNMATYKLFRPDLDEPTQEQFLEAARGLQVLPTPWVEPDDITNAAMFLASDDARFITGASLPVDAGALLK